MEPGRSGSREDEAIHALGREVGRRSVERLGTGLARIIEETSALYRWTLTMLVLLNGAALYLCVSARDSIGPDLFQQLVLTFFGGMMAALLAALVGMALTLPVAGAMRRAIAHWTDVSVSGSLSNGAMTSARQVKRSSAVWLCAMSLIVLTSLGLFGTGALLLGERFGMVGPSKQDSTVLEASIPPALEARPSDSPESMPDEIVPDGNEVSAAPVISPARAVAQSAPLAEPSPTPIQRQTVAPPQKVAPQKAPAPKIALQTANRPRPSAPALIATTSARQTSVHAPAVSRPITAAAPRPSASTAAQQAPPVASPPQPEFVPLPVLKPSIGG